MHAATKANTLQAGADVKESGLFRCWPSGRWDAHVLTPISVQVGVLIRRERGTEQRDQGRGL